MTVQNKTYNKLKQLILKNLKLFIFLTALLSALTFLVYLKGYNSPPIRSDGEGYYMYLPAVFIHGDLSFEWVEQEKLDYPYFGIQEYKDTDKQLNKYTIGMSVIWLPFFIFAHILSVLFSFETDGFSLFYHAIIGFAGIFFGALGFILLKEFLQRYFSEKVSLITTSSIFFGTSFIHYATYDSIFTHVFSFFFITLSIYITPSLYKEFSYKKITILAALLGLIVLIRPTNILLIIFIALYGIKSFKDFKERVSLFLKEYRKILLGILIAFIVVLPQILYWKSVTGSFIVNSYQEESFNFLKPEIFNILFSIEKGLFFWAPVLLLIFPGFLLIRKYLKEYFLASIVYIIVVLYVTSSWWIWQYGGSYGSRIFIDHFAILALPLASFIKWVIDKNKKSLSIILYIFILITVFINLFMMIQYWQGDIDYGGTTIEKYLGAWKHQFGLK